MKNEYKKAYKVVHRDKHNRYHSYFYGTTFSRVYSKSQEIFPRYKNSHLFVFKTLEAATDYISGDQEYEIWSVDTKNLRTPKISQFARPTAGCIEFFLKLKAAKKNSKNWSVSHTINIPRGTMICDSLKYVETVKIL